MSHHHHCHEEGSCCKESCHCHAHHHCHHEHEGSFADQLLELADEAWMEVLKEKIKAEIISKNGVHLDALAKFVSESNHARWIHKMELQGGQDDFHDKLDQFFKKK